MDRHGPSPVDGHDLQDTHEQSHIGRPGQTAQPQTIPLSKLPVGHWCSVWSVGGEGSLRRRLLDMGLTPGTRVMLRKTAPLGDPLELHLRGYDLSLRKDDAALVSVIEEGKK